MIDAWLIEAAGVAPELCAAVLLPRRTANPRPKAIIRTMLAKVIATFRNGPGERSNSCGHGDRTFLGRAVVGAAATGRAVPGRFVCRVIIEDADAKWFGGSDGGDGNGPGGKISGALSSGSSPGSSFESRRISDAGETVSGASCGASTGSSTSSALCSALSLTGCSGK